jgi:hypothetical protein
MAYTKDPAYNAEQMLQVMEQAKYIVRRHRDWFAREQRLAPMHKYVTKAIEMFRPDDWQKLLLQWPHMSTNHGDDYTKLAYTRDERAGIADRQTVISLGRFLRANFSVMPDEAIRDIVALAQSNASKFKIVHTTAEMIYHLHKGPGSCMQWDSAEDGVPDLHGDRHHPYEAYDPALGWAMAVRIEGDDTVGRALVNETDGKKTYVRSYKKSEGYSHADEQLEAWLESQGYSKESDWEDRYLKIIPARNHCGFVAPYIDGDYKGVVRVNDKLRIVEDDEGDFICNNTDGSADECNYEECTNCGERMRSGDGYWAGSWEEDLICSSCRDYSFTYVRGRNHRDYLVHEDNAVYVESLGEHYDVDYLDTNEIVQLRNGDYEHLDNAVEVDGDYYHVDDERIVRCVDDDEYHLKRDVYQCDETGEYYADEDNIPKDDESESESE